MNLSRIDSATGIIHSAGVKTGTGNLSAVKAEVRGLLRLASQQAQPNGELQVNGRTCIDT